MNTQSNMDKDKTIEQKKGVVTTGDSMLNGIHTGKLYLRIIE